MVPRRPTSASLRKKFDSDAEAEDEDVQMAAPQYSSKVVGQCTTSPPKLQHRQILCSAALGFGSWQSPQEWDVEGAYISRWPWGSFCLW